jgi:hypothetical protein
MVVSTTHFQLGGTGIPLTDGGSSDTGYKISFASLNNNIE